MWVAFAGLALTVFVTLFGAAFFMGRLSQRMKTTENCIVELQKSANGERLMRVETLLSVMGEQMTEVKVLVQEVQHQLSSIITSEVRAQRRVNLK